MVETKIELYPYINRRGYAQQRQSISIDGPINKSMPVRKIGISIKLIDYLKKLIY